MFNVTKEICLTLQKRSHSTNWSPVANYGKLACHLPLFGSCPRSQLVQLQYTASIYSAYTGQDIENTLLYIRELFLCNHFQ